MGGSFPHRAGFFQGTLGPALEIRCARFSFPAMQRILAVLLAAVFCAVGAPAAGLPPGKVFVNRLKFDSLVAKAQAGRWADLPIGARTARIGLALAGTPYVNYTLELHDRIEAPSVNMDGMDCWTFFEIALGTARALKKSQSPRPEDLLAMV